MSMGMGMSQQQSLKQQMSMDTRLSTSFGESGGDIPVYSLHKISRLLRNQPPQVSPQVLVLLSQQLIAANREYKVDSGNDWSCLTSNNLVWAIENVDEALAEMTTGPGAIPEEWAAQAKKVVQLFTEARRLAIVTIRDWFETNFEKLTYDMSGQNGKIPWPIIQRLRRNLAAWMINTTNPFRQNIEDMILEVASENGTVADTAEAAWELMGGKLFKPKRPD